MTKANNKAAYKKYYGILVETLSPFNRVYASPRDVFHIIKLDTGDIVHIRDHYRRGGSKRGGSVEQGCRVKVWFDDIDPIARFARVGR